MYQTNDAGYTALVFALQLKKFDNAEKLVRHGAQIGGFKLSGYSMMSLEEFAFDIIHLNKLETKGLIERLQKAKQESKL